MTSVQQFDQLCQRHTEIPVVVAPGEQRPVANAPSTTHDTGCGCYRCVIEFEPMAALLHRLYTSDPEIVDPWPLEGDRG